jgi:serine/threonine-protein kinase
MNETSNDTLFARMVLDQSFCTEDELKKCRQEYKKRLKDNPTTLEQILLEYGFVTKSQIDRVKNSITEAHSTSHQIPGYKILGKLGAGAMAVVYKARQISLDRTVAVKVLPKRFSENPDYVNRFYKEGRAAAKLNHNNIVQAIDVGEAGGYHYFVMEYVEGKTIYDDLAAGKVFSEDVAIEIILQVAHALAHAHHKGLIHRDVKPKNIMINKAGVIKLADMGLARETSDIKAAESEAGKAFGTPYYIAPEQIRGELEIDARADIYSLGCTLYHMITGRVPFQADNPSDVMRKHLKEPLIPPDHINTTLSAGISEVVEVAMAKKKQDRYNTAEELIEDLEAIRRGEPPLRARQRFNVQDLNALSHGDAIEKEESELYFDRQELVKYRLALVAMGAAIAILILIIFFMILAK